MPRAPTARRRAAGGERLELLAVRPTAARLSGTRPGAWSASSRGRAAPLGGDGAPVPRARQLGRAPGDERRRGRTVAAAQDDRSAIARSRPDARATAWRSRDERRGDEETRRPRRPASHGRSGAASSASARRASASSGAAAPSGSGNVRAGARSGAREWPTVTVGGPPQGRLRLGLRLKIPQGRARSPGYARAHDGSTSR